ncbi:MAG: stage V sporulation protein AD [Clostridia bacterium]|nr:stage V sporulation protein AD [Clostridia bacterium]
MKIGKQTIKLENTPKIIETCSVVGPRETEGPLNIYFDIHIDDIFYGEKTFEKAESKMLKTCVDNLLSKASTDKEHIDYIFAGDLLNQCIASGYCIRDLNIPFFGLYGACSTFCESMILASLFVNSNYASKAVAATSSHFCSAERQFRMPLEHGNQKTPTAQVTVTAAGSALIMSKDTNKKAPHITYVTPGKIIDMGITDMTNMGAAMAPAVFDTVTTHLQDTGRSPDYYDAIVTGDLGILGSEIVCDLCKDYGVDISKVHKDCGVLIFDKDKQDTHCGGSGCGCCASVFSGYFFELLKTNKINKVLLVATGALMSTVATQQGESIPSIAHAIAIENEV